MSDRAESRILTDKQWEALAPLIELCRPPHKTEHHNLRRTIEAIIWRHKKGAPWRDIPAELGPWWMAEQSFRRWGRHGVWKRLLQSVAFNNADGVKALTDWTNLAADGLFPVLTSTPTNASAAFS